MWSRVWFFFVLPEPLNMQCHWRLVNLICSYRRYDNMVFEAVVGLKEPYGSSNASIASYIEVRCHFLVDWINPLLTPYSVSFEFIWFLSKRGLPSGAKVCELHLVLGNRLYCIFFTLFEGSTCSHTVFLRAMTGSSLWAELCLRILVYWVCYGTLSVAIWWARPVRGQSCCGMGMWALWGDGTVFHSASSSLVRLLAGFGDRTVNTFFVPVYWLHVFLDVWMGFQPDQESFVWVAALLPTMALEVVSTMSFLVRIWDFKL